METICTDNEANFGLTEDFLSSQGVQLMRHASGSHEPFVERRIRTLKERMRAILNGVPFQLPTILL